MPSRTIPNLQIEPPPGGALDERTLRETFAQIQQNFEAFLLMLVNPDKNIMRLPAGVQGRINSGVVEPTWSASALSGTKTVAHDLGVVPIAVVFGSLIAPEAGKIPVGNLTETPDGTNFKMNAETKTAHTGTIKMPWVAIG